LKNSIQSSTRPPLLSALCILTFIGSTAGFIGYFLASLFFGKASELIIEYSSWHNTNAISPIYFTLIMVAFAFSLTGAIRMWKLHRDGFFIYTLSQLAILIIPVFWVNWNAFSASNAIFTLIFIIGYGLNLKWMN
jgi:flagellin-like protein